MGELNYEKYLILFGLFIEISNVVILVLHIFFPTILENKLKTFYSKKF